MKDSTLRPGEVWVRKRDGERCTVETVTRSTVEYCTSLLVTYKVKRSSFLKNFRWEGRQ